MGKLRNEQLAALSAEAATKFLRQMTPAPTRRERCHKDTEAQRKSEDVSLILFRFSVPLCLIPLVFSVSSVWKIFSSD